MDGLKLKTIIACCLALAACQSATEPENAVSPYSAEAFFETTSYRLASARAWSPDSTKLLVASDESGTFNSYSMDSAGNKATLTASTADAQLPVSFFPGDERILLSADQGGNELNHLYVRELDGEIRDLTPGEDLKAMFLAWSGDHQYFYVLTNERAAEAFDLYRFASTDYQRQLIFTNEPAWGIENISRDGQYLALRRENSSADSDLFLLNILADSSMPVLISQHSIDASYVAFDFSPDSSELIYGTNQHSEFIEAWRYSITDGSKTPLIQTDWSVEYLSHSDSGRYRVAGINTDARMVVQVTETASTQTLSLPTLPEGQLAQVRLSADDQKIAVLIRSDTSPPDIYVLDPAANTSSRLTTALSPAIDESTLVASQRIRYPSFDQLEIPAISYKPRGASVQHPVPALVWVHGGPGGQSTTGYRASVQHLVNNGYAVLMANNRGSSGYGKTFFHMDDRRHGEVDLDDIVYAERYLASLDWVDKDRIGIIGGSYGGYMVGAALAFRPQVFKVGINIYGVMNWERTLESIPPYWEAIRKRLYDELGDPAVDRERLRRISPLFHADNIRAPLLVVQGANDPRVLQVESDEIVAAVRANKVPVEYLVFDDEGHGFSRKANRIVASDAYVSFLDKYL